MEKKEDPLFDFDSKMFRKDCLQEGESFFDHNFIEEKNDW
jgi:hypothetical protein